MGTKLPPNITMNLIGVRQTVQLMLRQSKRGGGVNELSLNLVPH